MNASRETGVNPVLAGASARLALRQQNLGVLLPVLLHDVNGALNGVTLSTELLARLAAPAAVEGAGGSQAGTLLQRARGELVRLKQSLKVLEQRLLPTVAGQSMARGASLFATLSEAQAVLLPAVRRAQHELQLALPDDAQDTRAAGPRLAMRADEAFDLVAGLLIVAIEGAAPHSTLAVSIDAQGADVLLSVEHGGAAQAGVGLEIHRELLRQAASSAGGSVEWHQSGSGMRARLRLPLAEG